MTWLLALLAPAAAAELPATPRIVPLHQGRSSYRLSRLREHDGPERVPLDWVCWYVELGDTQIVLDTGIGDPAEAKRWGITGWTSCAMRLEQLGIRPDAIDLVTLSHGHFDHAGGLADFPNATVVMQRSERSLASATTPARVGSHLSALQDRGRLQLVDGDATILPGLEVLHTGGHTRGHQVVRLTGEDGQVHLFVGDACYTAALCLAGEPLPAAVAADPDANRQFMKQLGAWLDAGATVRTMHDLQTGRR